MTNNSGLNKPTQIRLTCPLDCPDACSLLVSLENNKATKIIGDPNHPTTQGFACSKTYKYPQRAYNPTRPTQPLRRVGEKGEGKWESVSWELALAEIAERLKKILLSHGPQSILRYNYAGTMGWHQGSHAHAFFRALGAIELEETICSTAGSDAWSITYGDKRFGVDPEDVPNAKLIFLWGINSLATNSHLTPFLTAARKNGARIVHIDPYQTRTSLFCDEHLKIKPGTDAALALAIANIIVTRNLHDQDFINQHANGFEDFASAAKAWPLERASLVTGLPASTIERIALLYANTKASYIRVGYGMTRHEGGGNALRAATILPILTGAWKHAGGGATLSTSGAFMFNRTKLGAAHLIKSNVRKVNMNELATALSPEENIFAMFVYNSNPVVVAPDSSRVIAGMKRQDLFTVVLENAMTETAELADYVLPATTFLEHEDLYSAYGHMHLSWNNAACPPYGQSKPNTWVFGELAKRLGLTESSVFWSAQELATEMLDTTHEYMQGITVQRLQQEGHVRLNTPRPFLPYADGTANTPDKKFRLSPAPEFILATETTSPEFPLRLMTPPAHHFLNSTYGEIKSIRDSEGGEPNIMIHPDDAEKYGATAGAEVRIISQQGSVRRKAKITDHTQAGVVVVEGTWWAKHAPDGQGINTLTSQKLTDVGAGSTFHNTAVRIEKC